MATSVGFPWTAGKLVLSAPSAVPPEKFTITGTDKRTKFGAGTIQMVAGSLSQRPLSGPNANRAWVRLVLSGTHQSPALSPLAQGSVVGLMLLAGGYMLRRRLLASRQAAA
jgi:hypothetical protein